MRVLYERDVAPWWNYASKIRDGESLARIPHSEVFGGTNLLQSVQFAVKRILYFVKK
jgi:hypothetical protein